MFPGTLRRSPAFNRFKEFVNPEFMTVLMPRPELYFVAFLKGPCHFSKRLLIGLGTLQMVPHVCREFVCSTTGRAV